MKIWAALLLAVVSTTVAAAERNPLGSSFGAPPPNQTGDEEEKIWSEQEVAPPSFPKPEDLIEVYVSAVATHKYFIDASTLAVGTDEVVRYVLVVKTSGGATNVSFEGMRCKDTTWKHYATGASDGTWTKSRAARGEWRPIENKPINRHHAAISRDLFCPQGLPIRTPDEGRKALRLGKHPNSI
jgi:hypothetical protein